MQNHHQNVRGLHGGMPYYGHVGMAPAAAAAQGYMAPHPGYGMGVPYHPQQAQQMHMMHAHGYVPHPHHVHAQQAWAASNAAASAAAAASASKSKKRGSGARKNSPATKKNGNNANDRSAGSAKGIVTSKVELRFIVEAAKRRYLDAHAVLFLLEMGAKGDIQPLQKVQRRPPSGSIFLYDRSRTPQFRVDGYEYVKKKGNAAAVREDHVKLKYAHEERIYACHVHSQERESMHRRSYWDLKNRNNLILVHYWDSAVGAHETHPMDCICIGCTLEIEEKGPTSARAAPAVVQSSASAKTSTTHHTHETDAASATDKHALSQTSGSASRPPASQTSSRPSALQPAVQGLSGTHRDDDPLGDLHDDDDFETLKLDDLKDDPQLLPHHHDEPSDLSGSVSFVKPEPELYPLSEAESAAQTRDDDEAVHDFLHDLNAFDMGMPRSPEVVSLVDVSSLEVQDLAPDVASVNGGTKMLISLAKIGGEPFSKSMLSVAVENVDVIFGDSSVVKGFMMANGVVRCKTPSIRRNTRVLVQVAINGMTIAPRGGSPPLCVHFCLYDRLEVAAPPPLSNLRTRLSATSNASPAGTPTSHNSAPRSLLKRKRSRKLLSPVPGASCSEGEDGDDPDMDELNDEELTELSESLLERVVKVLVDLCSEENDLLGELDALDDSGFNLLHYAVAFGHVKLVKLLLNHGADPNKVTSTGDAPLHLAAEVADMDVVGALLHAGSDTSLRDASGQTPGDLAEMHGVPELIHLLRNEGAVAPTGSPDDGGQNPKESLEDKQQKMLRKALASMSLKDRCALSLGVRDGDVASVTGSGSEPSHSRTSSFAGPSPDANPSTSGGASPGAKSVGLGAMAASSSSSFSSASLSSMAAANRDGGEARTALTPIKSESLEHPRESAKVKQIVSEQEPNLVAVMSSLNDEERQELEVEARIIQSNIRRWLLRRSVQATRKVQTETKGFRKEKEKEKGKLDIEEKATKVQAVSKGFLARKEYRQARQDVIQVQAATRCLLARKNFHAWRRQLSATLVIQRSIRERRRRIHEQESADHQDTLAGHQLDTSADHHMEASAEHHMEAPADYHMEASIDNHMEASAEHIVKTPAEHHDDSLMESADHPGALGETTSYEYGSLMGPADHQSNQLMEPATFEDNVMESAEP
ncbi:Ankyrin repeat and protein kinase domain-containing protein 1 [Hondaea fermentalgiana]|uniref:Ankyrin repeat and protein kinase domain-containing protein 1 n=1 Tax=Hondaea fermentalgiana TaxID=2315210 RepID=A0A2R5GB56_9STRA|nr:Ankyrin repeat and protein kinase domain-containing protein 1 [Hondaea fermentalgiana]|eukprot:GBG28227.1 Ankyrin repeat and protein kinase domain-containing protein 1 [Hondaea fermentalgiana]